MDTNTFKPSIDWGNELFNSARWILEAFASRALLAGGPRLGRAANRMGTPVLAHQRRLFQGQAECAGLRVDRGPARFDDRIGAHQRALDVLRERCLHGASSCLRRRRGGAQRGERLWHQRVLAVDDHLRHFGDGTCPALSAGHVLDAAVHHALANLVELPLRRQLARRPHVLPSSVPA